jgi:hypothetical protein
MVIIKAINEKRNSVITLCASKMTERSAQAMIDTLNDGRPQYYYPNGNLKDEDYALTQYLSTIQYSLVDMGCCHAEGKRVYLNKDWKLSIFRETYIV